MNRHKIFPAIKIQSADGAWLITDNGDKIFDGTSSWWCKHLGHRHPKIMAAINEQSSRYIHAIGANTYSTAIANLSTKLTNIYPNLNKVSFASDGSCAVEMALKMSLHTRKILYPEDKRRKIIKLAGAYHGETALAMSVSDCAMYKDSYKEILIETLTCPVPASCTGTKDKIWQDAGQHWQQILAKLAAMQHEAAILIIEPILQAANCMHLYSADFLRQLMLWAREHNIDIIADEIMTGFWRTGKLMACEYTDITPDFICLGKGLTAGSIPMSAVLATENRFYACYPEEKTEQPFLHSHTYSAHALAAATACAAIDIYLDVATAQEVRKLSQELIDGFASIPHLKNIRGIGCIVAAELNEKHFTTMPSPAAIQKHAAKLGLLIRPLDKTVYLCPPINTTKQELEHCTKAMQETLHYFKHS